MFYLTSIKPICFFIGTKNTQQTAMEAHMHCKKLESTVQYLRQKNMGKMMWTVYQVPFCVIAVTWLRPSKPNIQVIQLHINTSKALMKQTTE